MDCISTTQLIDQDNRGDIRRLERSALLLESVLGVGAGGSLWYYEEAPGHDPLLLQAFLTSLVFIGITALLFYLRWRELKSPSQAREVLGLKISAVLIETGLAVVVLSILWDYRASADTTSLPIAFVALVLICAAAFSIRTRLRAATGVVSRHQ